MKKVIVINPELRTVEETTSNLELGEIYDLLNANLMDITTVPFLKNNDLIVDDEGLLKDNYYFGLPMESNTEQKYIFAGNGILCKTNENGESISTDLTVEEIKAGITWYGFIQVKDIDIPPPEIFFTPNV